MMHSWVHHVILEEVYLCSINQLTDKYVEPYNIIRCMKLKATYTRRILAMMYFPDCEPANAVRRLTSEIKRCVELYALLTANGKSFDRKQILTIREVKLIEEYLGEPVYSVEEVLV